MTSPVRRSARLLFESTLNLCDSVFIRCCPFNRDGRIYPIPSTIARTPSLLLSRLRASLNPYTGYVLLNAAPLLRLLLL